MLRFERGDQSVPEGRTQEEVAYHVEQMIDAGLLKEVISRKTARGRRVPHFYHVPDITPAGHDFIAAIRSSGFWSKLKKHFEERTVPMTVELVVLTAKRLAAEALGLSGDSAKE